MSNFSDARKLSLAIWAFIKNTPRPLRDCERQIVAARLVSDAKIAASISPFIAMWRDAPTAFFSELRQQMGELVSQGAIDLREMFAQTRIQRDYFRAIIGAARARFQSEIPFHANLSRAFFSAERAQQPARL